MLEEKSKNDLQTQASAKDKEISDLTTQLEQLKQTLALENQRLLSQKEQEITELKSQLENLTSVKELELNQALSKKDKELVEVQNQLERLSLENKNSLIEAVAAVEKERDDAKSKLAIQEKEAELFLASVKSDYEAQLKAANEQVEFYKNFKAQQSTKAIGESLG